MTEPIEIFDDVFPADPTPVPPGFHETPSAPPQTGKTPIPPGFSEQPAPERDIGTIIVDRFLGTDVKDPLELTRTGTIVGGTILGGVAGAKVPGPPFVKAGTIAAGSFAGTLLGAAAPEMVMEAGESMGVLDPGTRDRTGLSPEELRTVLEGEALLDLATAGGFSILRTGGRLGAKVLTGTGREARKAAESAAEQGIEMMPVQVGRRAIGRGYVAVMGRFPWIGSRFKKIGLKGEEQLRKALSNASDRVGPLRSMSDLSEQIFTDARDLVKRTNEHFGVRYEDLFARADDLGVKVIPRNVLFKADEVLKKIEAQTPAVLAGDPSAGVVLNKVRGFITDEILVMRTATEGGTAFANQSLRQMDGVVAKIDQEIATLEPGQRKFAMELLIQLRQAATMDSVTNVRGLNAQTIAHELRELDTEFSHTISTLFESATAKRFQTVRRRGLRGITADEATRTEVDELARVIIRLDSPRAMDELSRLVSPQTYKEFAASIIDQAVTDSMRRSDDFGVQFVPDSFAKRLGLATFDGIPVRARRDAIKTMLEKSGSSLTIEHLDALNRAAQDISSLEIPNVSAFIARRATLGGLQGLLGGVLPGIALAGGASYAVGPLLGMTLFVGGGKLLTSILANPRSARALRKVIDKEATQLVKKQATVDALRFGLAALREAGDLTLQEFGVLEALATAAVEAYDKEIQRLRGK